MSPLNLETIRLLRNNIIKVGIVEIGYLRVSTIFFKVSRLRLTVLEKY
jgi:hypothetical protein